MSEGKSITLLKAAKELNIGIATAVEFLGRMGHEVEARPATKLSSELYQILLREFQGDKIIKEEANQINIGRIRRDEAPVETPPAPKKTVEQEEEILIKSATVVADSPAESEKKKADPIPEKTPVSEKSSVGGMKVVGKVDLDNLHKGVRSVEKAAKKEEPSVDKKVAAPQEEATPLVEKKEVAAPTEKATQVAPPDSAKESIDKSEQSEVKSDEKSSNEKTSALKEKETSSQKTAEKAVTKPVNKANAKDEKSVDSTEKKRDSVIRARAERLQGPNVVGRIELPTKPARGRDVPVASSSGTGNVNPGENKRKRKRKENTQRSVRPGTPGAAGQRSGGRGRQGSNAPNKEELTDKQIQDQIKATLARLSGAGKSGKFAQRAKLRRQKRDDVATSAEEAAMEQEMMSRVLQVTEFVTANDLANLMDVPVTQIISTCMSLGLFVSINQRLDAETIAILADEFGFEIEFIKPEEDSATILEEDDDPDRMTSRSPIVTVMGHVDHGKTSLLDYIRKANVIAGEAGGITQHIGAYEVRLDNGKKITFLDTPGHEAFTAMRARGAQVTDIAIIVIAADDSVMPQTKEAINHAQAAGVPIVFAFTKIDKPTANADKVREQLSAMNILVEDWGGKYQSQEISGKTGLNVDLLLEKVLLEAELLELKADPGKRAVGSVIEASLDKGKGIVTTVLIQSGTLRVGDPILAGSYSGRVKAINNERGQRIQEAGPSTPVQILGMSGAPTAGDKFYVLENEHEARTMANKRLQLQREQGMRTQKHITLDEIGRRLAIGNFKELNIIVKGDVDGSIEALSDSLLKMSTEEIQVNVIHKSVGQISESDVLLATASDAIIIGFQVRPSVGARKLAEQEQIDIRLYSIIYDAIEELKSAIEGMHAPKFEEKIVANVEIRETFKISKVGTIAGCMVLDGKINRNHDIRVIRDGVVVYTGKLASLKRYKDDVKEVSAGYECGLNILNFNDIKVGDIVEAYEQVEVKRKA